MPQRSGRRLLRAAPARRGRGADADAGAPGGETDAGAPDEDATPGSDDEKSSGGGDGCVAAPGAPGGEAPAALALLGFLALRRRRGDRTTRA